MKFLSRPGVIFFLLCGTPSFCQTISGVVNIYTEVTAVSGADVTVASAAGFSVGDRVLLIQMQGAEVDVSETPTFGDIIDYHNAGYYEFATIIAIAGLVITVENPFCRDYDVDGAVQLIRVAVYDDVTITGTVTADPWDGATGGVVAIEVANTITFNADIDVDGLGFRGGTHCTSFFACAVDDYASNYTGVFSCIGGKKGEGIAIMPGIDAGSRGKAANGGGGSNSGQHGGAGGSNYGQGGVSAYQWTGCFPYDDIWAFGGAALDYISGRVFMGGGGGGGHQDNGLEVTDGSNGGGIVFITATTIDGLGNAINANGDAVAFVTDSEGAGGGGGGGAVILRAGNYPSDLLVNARGGDGGSIESTLWAGTCHGPGGGGGGGFLGLSLAAVPATVFFDAVGGDPGIITSPGAFCDGTPHGAEAGLPGGTGLNLATSFVYPEIDLGNDTTVCVYLDPYILDAGPDFDSYLWNDGSTDQTYDVFNDGTYFVTVSNAFGCEATDTIDITVNDAPPLNLPDTIQFCAGEGFTLDAGVGATTYLWQNGTVEQTFTATEGGTYWVTITNAIGCATSDTCIVLAPWILPVVDLGADTIICLGDEVILNAVGDGYTYLWNNGATGSSLTVTVPGLFSVAVTDTNGCVFTDEINLSPGCGHDIFVPNAFSPNADGMNDLYNVVPYNELLSYHILIFNRWGQQIFESNDLATGWDGTVANIPAEVGVYLYVINYEVQTFEGPAAYTLNGTVTLLR